MLAARSIYPGLLMDLAPSSDRVSQVSNKADRSSESPTHSEGGLWNAPPPGLSVGDSILGPPQGTDRFAKSEVEPVRDASREQMDLDGNESLNVGVLLAANVPDAGFLLDHAGMYIDLFAFIYKCIVRIYNKLLLDTIGLTSLSVLRDWTDTE